MTAAPTGRERKAAVAAAFGAAAASYDANADLQQQVAGRLATRITALPLPPAPRVLEIGCGTGFLSRALAPQLPGARWVISDLAEPMVRECRRGFAGEAAFLVMDGERPCLAGGFDLICASLALQWFTDPGAALAAWAGLLRPGGHLAFATLAAGTFATWRAAHLALGLRAGVPDYPDAGRLTGLLPGGGSGGIEIEAVRCPYPDGRSFLSTLRRIGADVPAEGHRPLPPGQLRRVLRRFEPPAGLTETYQTAYGLFRREDRP
ncbi:MAG: methyltransferase domain-containing protein [Rhodospirillaceae bacterium]